MSGQGHGECWNHLLHHELHVASTLLQKTWVFPKSEESTGESWGWPCCVVEMLSSRPRGWSGSQGLSWVLGLVGRLTWILEWIEKVAMFVGSADQHFQHFLPLPGFPGVLHTSLQPFCLALLPSLILPKIVTLETSLASPAVRLHFPVQRVGVWPLVGELRSHMPWGQKNVKKTNNAAPPPRTTIVTNSMCCCSVAKSCSTFCDPMDSNLPGSSLSMEFSWQEYWSEFPFPSPGILPDPGIEPVSPALGGRFFNSEPPGKPKFNKDVKNSPR